MSKYLMEKAVERVASLENVKSFELIFEWMERKEHYYTSDLLKVEFKDGTVKLYLYNITLQSFVLYK